MNNSTSEMMLQVVKAAKERAREAEYEYDRGAAALQANASQNINLFGGSAVSQVADIARDSRRICDALYASYQTLVKMVDEQCRPLLEKNPELSAVRKVRDLIKWLNDESEIENNFTASLNSRSLGGVASGRYIPSIENKMIQSFWENKYHMWPGREEERKENEANVKRRQAVAEKQKTEFAAMRKKEIAELENSQLTLARWEMSTAEVKYRRDKELKETIERAEGALKKRIQGTYEEAEKSAKEVTVHCKSKCAERQEELGKQGFFSFSEKGRLKKEIRDLKSKMCQAEKALINAKDTYERELQEMEIGREERVATVQKMVEEKYPLPQKPSVQVDYITYGSGANDIAKLAILRTLERCGELKITEIHDMCPEINDFTYQRTTALIRQLVESGYVKRSERNCSAFFTAVEKWASEKKIIIDYLKRNGPCSVSQLVECPKLKDISLRELGSILCVLADEGKVIRFEDNKKVSFKV